MALGQLPKKLVQTDAENKALDILHENKAPLSEQDADHAAFVSRMALYYNAGDMEVVNDARSLGLLNQHDMNTIKLKAKEGDLLTGVMRGRYISPDSALDIYKNYATPEEQKKLHSIMLKKKYQALRGSTPASRAQLLKDWSIVK